MTRRRSRSESVCQCPDHRQHAYVPADPEAVKAALERFERTLSLLPDPLAGAISTLTVQDVRSALSRSSDRDRAAVFRTVGLPTINPKKHYGDRLCEDVLTRLRDANRFDIRSAAILLTVPLARVLFGWIGAQTTQKPDDWPDALARLALWARMGPDAGYVRILLAAAAQQEWWCPPGVSTDLGESLLEAARDVVKATPDYMSSVKSDSHSDPLPDDGAELETPEIAENQAAMAEEPDLRELMEKLDTDWVEARASAARVLATLESGLPADVGDLTAMMWTITKFPRGERVAIT